MTFWGCEKCGVALNAHEIRPVVRDGRLQRACPECRRPMGPISLAAAVELIREREEADRWRAGGAAPEEPAGAGG
jgi:hypothetical protein